MPDRTNHHHPALPLCVWNSLPLLLTFLWFVCLFQFSSLCLLNCIRLHWYDTIIWTDSTKKRIARELVSSPVMPSQCIRNLMPGLVSQLPVLLLSALASNSTHCYHSGLLYSTIQFVHYSGIHRIEYSIQINKSSVYKIVFSNNQMSFWLLLVATIALFHHFTITLLHFRKWPNWVNNWSAF